MRRERFVCLFLAGLAVALAAAGCGGSADVTGPEAVATPAPAPTPVTGAAILQGTVVGTRPGLQVGVVGTPLLAPVDDEGQFVLSRVPAGTVTLKIEGAGIDARLSVSGLQDGQVTSITVQVSGGSAQLTGTPNCTPTAETFFSGLLEQMAGTQLVVAGQTVDASQVRKVWRGNRRIQLSDLQIGEKVKVWGTLRGDGVVVAEEIAALTTGPGSTEVYLSFGGRVDSVSVSSRSLHANPNTTAYPTLSVAGYTVKTSGSTTFKWSDGTALDARQIKAGDYAYVEGWSKPAGYVAATKVVVNCR